ncbi:hypothetical protein GCM10010404_87650 [Nonomuraea africana]|uniref:DNA repair photolyase n=1 Tax=Nonomuraea africana TaxID=46171 RepID=A0ABR9KE89_9ACTN|nr:intein-containing Rv2578c family radical SAM protein [Nonomuraea africana]MBE1560317.1 DNA repair photolyase [Nonomuraea africana]
MRWDNLRLADDASGDDPAVPLFARGAVARTFDTPEFKGMTFYEIQAKSIINKVPAASRVPFSYTINPYRGCSHACSYCLAGDTPVLMADGRTRPIAELRAGDRIYGTRLVGGRRRYVVTEVLDHWSTVKAAHRVTLADGTRLVASGEHRFLTARGWKHVTGDVGRPSLGDGDRLVGGGRFAEPPEYDDDYRRGYLFAVLGPNSATPSVAASVGAASVGAISRAAISLGAISGGAVSLGAIPRVIPRGAVSGGAVSKGAASVGAVPGGVADRVRSFLDDLGLGLDLLETGDRVAFGETPTDVLLEMGGLALGRTPTDVERARPDAPAQGGGTIEGAGSVEEGDGTLEIAGGLPARPSWGWLKGFLAGAFDRDPASITLEGGAAERLRFLHTVDPASADPHGIEGAPVESAADVRVLSVEPLGVDVPMYDITTGTGDFIADGLVSHNCFARKTHEYLDLDAGHDFDSKIIVKVNAAELARKELATPRWGGHHVAMGTNVDCYQRAEGRYQLMPGILRALTEAANPFSILTKGTLILRDLPLLEAAARVTEVSTAVSVGFVDAGLWRAVEPGTPNPRRRLEACRRLTDSGIPCGVLMAPILPYLSDSPDRLEATVREIAAAGATHVTPIVLHLRPGAREWFLGWLAREHPRLVPRYLELYGRGAYAPKSYQERVSTQVRELARQYGIGRTPSWRIQPDQPPQPEQLSLL